MKALLEKIRKILRDRRTRKFLTRFVSGVAALVVFVTTYALVLPAITMESQAECGVEAHQHDDSCYSENLVCGQEESEGHHPTEDCYTVTRELVCPLEEHEHSSESGCFAEDGSLICTLEEHTHYPDVLIIPKLHYKPWFCLSYENVFGIITSGNKAV